MTAKKQTKLNSILDSNNTQRPNPYDGVEYPNIPISSIEYFKKYVDEVTADEPLPPSRKYFCVMLFYEMYDITGDQADIDKWINTKNVYFRNGTLALDYFANTPCQASQIIDALTIEELAEERNNMLLNFKDEKFLNELKEHI